VGGTARRPKYPVVPAALLGLLAVDQQAQGQRLGERLLMDALRRTLRLFILVATVTRAFRNS
jgi:GNAT superfamily N-acetyltransferase